MLLKEAKKYLIKNGYKIIREDTENEFNLRTIWKHITSLVTAKNFGQLFINPTTDLNYFTGMEFSIELPKESIKILKSNYDKIEKFLRTYQKKIRDIYHYQYYSNDTNDGFVIIFDFDNVSDEDITKKLHDVWLDFSEAIINRAGIVETSC